MATTFKRAFFNEVPQMKQTELDNDSSNNEREENEDTQIPCSAVSTMERDIPDFDYSDLVEKLKNLLLKEFEANPGLYAKADHERCKSDEWFIARFLLRNKLNVDDAFEMMKRAMRFDNENLCHALRPQDFPSIFYQVGGLFHYAPDRKGNKMLYLRVKMHKKISEIQTIIHSFIYFHLKWIDNDAGGKGIVIVIDCSGAGLANADMELLWYLITTIRNYFPKGLSYFLVHELPWILRPFWPIARAWVPEEHAQLVKFSTSQTIFEYVDRENLPDYMGGTCKLDYRKAPENCSTLEEAAKLWGIEDNLVRKILAKYQEFLPEGTIERYEESRARILSQYNDDNNIIQDNHDERSNIEKETKFSGHSSIN